MTTEAERLAELFEIEQDPESLYRQAAALLRSQAAEIERLKAAWTGSLNLAENIREERDKANTLLRQALESLTFYIEEDDVLESMPGNEFWVSGKHKAESTLSAIKTHLGE